MNNYPSEWPEDEDEPSPMNSRMFFELCQTYRNASGADPVKVAHAFDEMKKFMTLTLCRVLVNERCKFQMELRSAVDAGDELPDWLLR